MFPEKNQEKKILSHKIKTRPNSGITTVGWFRINLRKIDIATFLMSFMCNAFLSKSALAWCISRYIEWRNWFFSVLFLCRFSHEQSPLVRSIWSCLLLAVDKLKLTFVLVHSLHNNYVYFVIKCAFCIYFLLLSFPFSIPLTNTGFLDHFAIRKKTSILS